MRIHPMYRLALASAIFLAQGCEAEMENPRCSWRRGSIDLTAEHHQYVVDSIRFGSGPSDAYASSLDLDCDELARNDNSLGQALSAVYSWLDTDLDQVVADMIDSGRIVQLIDVQAQTLEQATDAGVQIFIGEDLDGDPSDNFSGSEVFAIAPGTRTSAMAGRIEDSVLTADFGDVPLQVALPGVDQRFVLELEATAIEAEVYADHLEARVAGVLHVQEIEDNLLPVIHLAIVTVLESECDQGVCPPGSRGAGILGVLDTDADGLVTYEEFHDNELVQALLAPDLDMYDQEGRFAPDSDGVRDSLSLGVAVTAVRAQL